MKIGQKAGKSIDKKHVISVNLEKMGTKSIPMANRNHINIDIQGVHPSVTHDMRQTQSIMEFNPREVTPIKVQVKNVPDAVKRNHNQYLDTKTFIGKKLNYASQTNARKMRVNDWKSVDLRND